MSVVHTNRKGQTYYLHVIRDQSEGSSYHFSLDSSGDLATAVPKDHEIYEHPNGQVYCRRKQKEVINIEEVAMIATGIQVHSDLDSVIIDVQNNNIIVYTPNPSIDDLAESFFSTTSSGNGDRRQEHSRYHDFDPVLRFVLTDKESRLFAVQRYYYRGSIYDWINLSASSAKLAELAREYLPHLGKDSFYDLC